MDERRRLSNLITDVRGLRVGQAMDGRVRTGVTVILPDERAICAVDVRGGGPGTRETDALGADTLVDAVDAVVLSGGSVYGLAAADGVAAWLGARGRGYGLVTTPGVPRSPVSRRPFSTIWPMAATRLGAWIRPTAPWVSPPSKPPTKPSTSGPSAPARGPWPERSRAASAQPRS